ncbi:MAG: peptide-methionine (R)-S-oxide reductase MsrB [Proteobacteria bacterium]|nr:peptide-methionine (R)-S-oxide reductase MsrB [Pseudomonadota bacterium]MCP4921273.1 peptide-methionine (R)-S-oxide reductase MsrB [Pseudomonadota bacterium]
MKKDPALSPDIDVNSLHALDWRELLRPDEYAVLRQSGTERPGTGRYLKEERAGAYHCAGCGQKLYGGDAKFHSGCGWPSFYEEVEDGALTTVRDASHGMVRVEMRCSRCDGHLGHIFQDAPQTPTGLRHCVNGTALVFVPEGEDALEVIRKHRQG